MIRPFQKLSLFSKDQGSAVVEFILVSVPLVALSIGVIAVSLTGFTQNVIRDSAIEGARFASLADQTSQSGCTRAREQLEKILSNKVLVKIICGSTELGETTFESVRISATLPLVSALLPIIQVTAVGSAPREN